MDGTRRNHGPPLESARGRGTNGRRAIPPRKLPHARRPKAPRELLAHERRRSPLKPTQQPVVDRPELRAHRIAPAGNSVAHHKRLDRPELRAYRIAPTGNSVAQDKRLDRPELRARRIATAGNSVAHDKRLDRPELRAYRIAQTGNSVAQSAARYELLESARGSSAELRERPRRVERDHRVRCPIRIPSRGRGVRVGLQ